MPRTKPSSARTFSCLIWHILPKSTKTLGSRWVATSIAPNGNSVMSTSCFLAAPSSQPEGGMWPHHRR